MCKEHERFQFAIVRWHNTHKRKFPWRETKDPFKIIIAEITLKLTGAWKAEKVYSHLAECFGSPEKMATANLSELSPLFKPLGLFKRTQMLVDIATEIRLRFNGEIPKTYDELVSIKGIGQYTANAVLCFGYNERVPLVDGSVSRVFKRCFNYQSQKEAYADKKLWELALDFLPERGYRDYNLALLDLGALVCKHAKPLHDECPVKSICYTHLQRPL